MENLMHLKVLWTDWAGLLVEILWYSSNVHVVHDMTIKFAILFLSLICARSLRPWICHDCWIHARDSRFPCVSLPDQPCLREDYGFLIRFRHCSRSSIRRTRNHLFLWDLQPSWPRSVGIDTEPVAAAVFDRANHAIKSKMNFGISAGPSAFEQGW